MIAALMPLTIPSPAQGVWHLGPVPIRGYALCIIAGVVFAIWLGERRWVARGGQAGDVSDIAIWAVPLGIIGGRLYHVMTDYKLYFGEDGDPDCRALRLARWPRDLGWHRPRRGRRCHRRPPEEDQALADAGCAGAGGLGRPGHGSVGQLVQPGTLRPSDGSAVGAGDRRRASTARVRRVRDVPPDLPLRVSVEPCRVRVPDVGGPAIPTRPRSGGGAVRHELHGRSGVDRGAAHRQRPDEQRAGVFG